MSKEKVTRGAAACVAGCLALFSQPMVLAQDAVQQPEVVREGREGQHLHDAIREATLLRWQEQEFVPLVPDAELRSDEELGVQIDWHTNRVVNPGDYFVYQLPSTLVFKGLTHFDVNNGPGTPVIAQATIDDHNKLTVTFNDYSVNHSVTGRGTITITASLDYVAKRDQGYITIDLGEFGVRKFKVKPAKPSEPQPLTVPADKTAENHAVATPEIRHIMNFVPLPENVESVVSATPMPMLATHPGGMRDNGAEGLHSSGLVVGAGNHGDAEIWKHAKDALIDEPSQLDALPEETQLDSTPDPARRLEPAREPKPLDPEAPAVLAREQEAVRDVPRNAGRVIERPRSIIEMLFPPRDKNRDKQNSEASQTSESSVAPTSAAASASATQGASSTNIQPASGAGSATGTASVIPGVHKPSEDPKSRELIAGADHHHHDTEDDSVDMDDRHEIRQMQGDALGGQPVAAVLINLTALAIMVGGAFLLLRLR